MTYLLKLTKERDDGTFVANQGRPFRTRQAAIDEGERLKRDDPRIHGYTVGVARPVR